MTSPSRLFDPVRVGALALRNRIVMAPMTRRFSPGGVPTEEVGAYYLRRAQGGCGAIVTEGLEIDHPGAVDDPAIPNFFRPEALVAWRRILQGVQSQGCAFIPQLWHIGGAYAAAAGGGRAVSPSGVHQPGETFGAAASDAEIADLIGAYGRAAQAALEIGCDGVELHGAHGYLLDQFFWRETNLRTDDWGGETLKARTRFACEVVAECRRRTGPDFPILFRFSQWKLQDYTARLFAAPAELEAFLGSLADAGVDVFDCSTRRFWLPEFEGSDMNLAGWTQKLGGRPAMTVGSVGLDNDVVDSMKGGMVRTGAARLDVLEHMLEHGDFTLVGVGRALLADPQWPRKVEAGAFGDLRGFTMEDLKVLT